MPHGSIIASQIGPIMRVGNDNSTTIRDGRVSSSSPLTNSGMMHGSPLSDDSSQHSDSGIPNGVLDHSGPKPLDNALYSQCIITMYTLAKDPSPRIANLGRRVLSIIGIEQVVAKPLKTAAIQTSESTASHNHAGLARSSSWLDMNRGRSLPCFIIISQRVSICTG